MPETGPTRKRNMDRRRESSRHAARDRRGKETNIFTELKDVVPLVNEPTITHIDRIAQLRLAATLVRLRGFAPTLLKTTLNDDDAADLWSEELLANCLDGFVMVCGTDGVILYVTESVSIYLGLTQTDLVGRLLQDFVGRDDYEELSKIGAESDATSADGRLFVMRMKSVISPRGRNLNLKSALMKPMTFRLRTLNGGDKGRIYLLQAATVPAGQGNSYGSVAKGDAPSGTFMTRHTCDMKFSYVNESVSYYLKLEPKTLMGTSFYDIVHPADLPELVKCLKELFKKTHCRTPYYRLVGATGAVAWVQTEATTVSHTTRGQRGQYVICVHQMLGVQSGLESSTAQNVVEDSCPAAVAALNIKAEIDDTEEYLGLEPQQTIECVEFTPLINESSYRQELSQPTTPRSGRVATRKDLYNDVLQWLFRDHPDSPPPNIAFGRSSTDSDPTLSTVAFARPRLQSEQPQQICFRGQQPQCNPIAMDSGTPSPYARTSVSSPMDCCSPSARMDGLRLQPPTGGYAQLVSPRPTGQPSVADDSCYGNSPIDARLANANRQLSAVQAVDCNVVPNALNHDDCRRQQLGDASMFPVLSPAHPKVAIHPRAAMMETNIASNDSSPGVESPELLETLAPFVAQGEMMPLDLEGLLPDFNFDDWFQADPKLHTNGCVNTSSSLNNKGQFPTGQNYSTATNTQFQQQPQQPMNINTNFQPLPQQQLISNISFGQQQPSGTLSFGCSGQSQMKFNGTGTQFTSSNNNNGNELNVTNQGQLKNINCTEPQWDSNNPAWNARQSLAGGQVGAQQTFARQCFT